MGRPGWEERRCSTKIARAQGSYLVNTTYSAWILFLDVSLHFLFSLFVNDQSSLGHEVLALHNLGCPSTIISSFASLTAKC
jgi:hypothetical protein